MNSTIKKLALLLSFTTLVWNISPVFGQVIELEVLGGGYKLRGPAIINFADAPASTGINPSTLNFINLGSVTPSESNHNYIEVIDENGGNPYDVTVSSDAFKRSELLETTIIPGSTTTSLQVDSSAGFFVGDNFILNGTSEGTLTISAIPNNHTINISSTLREVPSDSTILRRIVDCTANSKKCIPLENFSIANNGSPVDVVNGNPNDFTLNTQTASPKFFGGRTTTMTGSSGNTLKVVDSSVFDVGDILTFDDASISPRQVTVNSINDTNTITLNDVFSNAPGDGIGVSTASSRTLTLGNGTGAAPGDFKIYPFLQVDIAAGQMPGKYQTVLNFTII